MRGARRTRLKAVGQVVQTRRWPTRGLISLSPLVLIVFAMVGTACVVEGGSPRVSATVMHEESTTSASTITTPTAPTTSVAATTRPAESMATPTTSRAPVTITVVYDNHAIRAGTRADWGFSCLIEGLEKTVLFDTGKNGDILLQNMLVLQLSPEDVDVVVLSHAHADHTGGLASLLARNPSITVYYPASFPVDLTRAARAAGASLAPVNGPLVPCKGLLITKPMGSPSESALLVETARGEVLVTGCAHPGLLEMTAAASALADSPIFAVLGGFHLSPRSPGEVGRIIEDLRHLGVERCGPAHCTGEAATVRIRAAFAGAFIEMGVGSAITF
jgi:7,8-dihydropterin-6-yl-methyl-4-(beta-D-ribofuranosyl)aminobenzene 5'-phosphate synthase